MKLKKTIAILSVCSMLLTAVPFAEMNTQSLLSITASAVETGSYTYLNYNKYTDHIEITGHGSLPEAVVIPSEIDGLPVTAIADNAFSSGSAMTSITLPSTLTSIGEEAFELCSGLTSIEIPNGVTSIGASAFYSCSKITSMKIPNSVTSTCNEIREVVFTKILQMKYADRLAA